MPCICWRQCALALQHQLWRAEPVWVTALLADWQRGGALLSLWEGFTEEAGQKIPGQNQSFSRPDEAWQLFLKAVQCPVRG